MRRSLTVCVIAWLAATTPADAQVTVQPGATVRVTAPTAGIRRFEGSVLAATGDTLDVGNGKARVRVPASAVTMLEVSRGRSRSAGAARGALIGAGVGLVLGAATYSSFKDTCEEQFVDIYDTCEPLTVGYYLSASTLGGAFWGTVVGAIVGRERWDVVTMPGGRTSMQVTPWVMPAGRAGVAVTIR